MTAVTVSVGARLHFGFTNLSLAHERLYGSLGVALERPRVTVTARPAETVACSYDPARPAVARIVDLLDVPGASVSVEETLPRHVGLGSGTQTALATLSAVARAYDRDPAVRERAPALDRGGRSGVGVATFERGGFVLDGGHPTAAFTPTRPDRGEWSVPPITSQRSIPDHWRFLLVIPDVSPGTSGDAEDTSMRATVERADPGIADRIAGVVVRRVLPALADGDATGFGAAVDEVGRLNGEWYADEQGGVYRASIGAVVRALRDADAVAGAGQSSWGPTVYGVTTAAEAGAARRAGQRALDAAGVDGRVSVVRPRNAGATVE
ncbi:beta-ribofuranosylaminobenzene 5'-phosphate synthase [Halolamina litorea]|uniref:Beta-ribofuranosylaminobenzene 5'-phosphate synthase n=1 Tax=Halolamina litorea TaxID=1515593 RepID=A0ABD6BSS3_9EURY|nr:beta-ribofuranosylaminobenzene 5'-phosphate synthase family protein [Halolamina litorea]